MNYFGMFFTFMLPGLVLGAMAASAIYAEKTKKQQKKSATRRADTINERSKLYVHSLSADIEKPAA